MSDSSPFYVSRLNPDSKHLFVLFTAGTGGGLGGNLFRCSGMYQHNALILRNPHIPQKGTPKGLYQCYLSDEVQTFGDLRAWLHGYIAQKQWKSVTFMGFSEAAYAAVLYGHYLKADHVFAFAPPTDIKIDKYKERNDLPEDWDIPEENKNLGKLLSQHNGVTHYNVYFCKDFKKDIKRIEHLKDCPGVTFFPQPGNVHTVIKIMDENGSLAKVFEQHRANILS